MRRPCSHSSRPGGGTIGPEIYALASAALVLAIGALAIGALLVGRRGWLPRTDVEFATWSGVLAALLSVGAAAIHFAVVGEHFAESPAYGVVLAALAWFQVGWAVLYVVRPRRGLASLAVLVNLGALIVWAGIWIMGPPIGEPGNVATTGPLDLLAGAFEVLLIGILGWSLAAPMERSGPSMSPSAAVAYLGSAMLAVVILTSTAFAAAGGSSHSERTPGAPTASGEASADGHAHGSPVPSGETSAAVPSEPVPPLDQSGAIVFGSGLDLAGLLQDATTTIRGGQVTTWLVELNEPPEAASIRLMILQVLPDGREVEHWRQEIAVVDPGARQLVGMADLSVYLHGGAGSYRMEYLRGDELLAQGAFEFIP